MRQGYRGSQIVSISQPSSLKRVADLWARERTKKGIFAVRGSDRACPGRAPFGGQRPFSVRAGGVRWRRPLPPRGLRVLRIARARAPGRRRRGDAPRSGLSHSPPMMTGARLTACPWGRAVGVGRAAGGDASHDRSHTARRDLLDSNIPGPGGHTSGGGPATRSWPGTAGSARPLYI